MLYLLLYSFYGVAAIQLFYYLFIFRTFSFAKQQEKKSNSTPISVLICAKNEAAKLKDTLDSIAIQEHPNFELVLINDRSIDLTLDIMENFLEKHSEMNIKIVNVKDNEEFWGNKKYALTLGIKAASFENLLFTDADCKPVSKHWIQEMSIQLSTTKTIVLGYGAYDKIKGSLLNKLIRYETLITAMQYFSFAKIGLAYMGVGRNIAYTKKQFYKKNGFASHFQIRSGDDDLFVNENATKKNTAICFSKESFTTSIPKKTFKEWIQQKRRHVSTARHYKTIHQVALGLLFTSQLLFWALAIALLSVLFSYKIVLTIVIVRILILYFIVGLSAKKLKENDLIILIPFLELFLIVFQMIIFIKNLIAKPTHW